MSEHNIILWKKMTIFFNVHEFNPTHAGNPALENMKKPGLYVHVGGNVEIPPGKLTPADLVAHHLSLQKITS